MAITFSQNFSIPASPERVYAVLTDAEQCKHWMHNFVAIEPLNDLPPFTTGYRFKETRKMFGKAASEVFEIKEAQAPSKLVMYIDGKQGSSKRGYYLFTYTLQPQGSGTLIKLDAEMGGTGKFYEWLGRLFVGMFKKAIAKDMQAMADYITKSGI